MLSLTSPVETPLHHLPAPVKLGGLALFTILLFVTERPGGLLLALCVVTALHCTGGRDFLRHALRMIRPLWPFVALLILWHLVARDIESGLVIALRMVTAVAAANLVTMTTRLADMLTVIERLCQPLAPIVPPRRLAIAFALTIRFIPVLSTSLARLREAWRARSARRIGWRILVPGIIVTLDDADHAAEALRARGGAG